MIKELLADPKVHAEIQTLLLSLVTLLSTVVGWLVMAAGRWIVAKTKAEHNALYAMFASRLVAYANQKMADSANVDKAQFVADALKKQFPSLPDADIQHLLEEAVVNFKAQLQPNATVSATATVNNPPPAVPAQGA